MIKAKKLRRGDKVAAISLSWGGAGAMAHRYEVGKRQLQETFGLQVVETRHALREPEWLEKNPQARAQDLMEASEDAPPPIEVARELRSYAAMGILPKLSAILFARPGGDVPPDKFIDYDNAILKVVVEEEGLTKLPIITHMDFGHTEPIFTLPLGVQGQIDCDKKEFAIIENAVVE